MYKSLVKSSRKVLSCILAFFFTLSLFTIFLPLKAIAATYNDYDDNGFVYRIYSDHAVAVGYNYTGISLGSLGLLKINIRSYINNVPVTEIGAHALSDVPIDKIQIPETVKRINGTTKCGAFSGTKLTTVNIPDNVEYLGLNAFGVCRNLESIYIENPYCEIVDNQSVINNGANLSTAKSYFYGTIYGYPGSTAEAYAKKYGYQFADIMTGDVIVTSNQSSTQTTTTTKITKTTTTAMPKTTISTTTTTAIEKGNCGENVTYTLKDGVLTISGNGPMADYNEHRSMVNNLSKVEKVIINDGVKTIGRAAFMDCINLSSVIIPDSVTFIGIDAFGGCKSLKTITIPQSVTKIGVAAFADCTNLTSIRGYSNSIAETYAKDYGIEFISLGGTTTSQIQTSVSTSNKVTSQIKTTSTTSKVETTIANTNITNNAAISESYKENKDNLNYIVEGNTLTISGVGEMFDDSNTHGGVISTYYKSSIYNVIICDGVKNIANNAFYGCNHLTSVIIPNSVKNIGDYAFRDCSSLTSVTIPNSVTNIGDSAFSNCSSLTSVTIPNSVKNMGVGTFAGCSHLTSVTIPNSVTNIANYAFDGCNHLTSVIIPNSVKNIGVCAFRNCSSLTSVTIPDSVTNIGFGVFWQCNNLTSISIPNSVRNIGFSAFCDCSCLTSVTIPNSVTNISGAFCGCSRLTSITIPNSVTNISGAFRDCISLTSVTIPNSVTNIEDAFLNCSSLTSVIIPDSVTNISGAFRNCSSLTSVTIPDSVTDIRRGAFCGCSHLTSVTIPNSVTNIGSNAFDSNVVIKGYKNTEAEIYATNNNIQFIALDEVNLTTTIKSTTTTFSTTIKTVTTAKTTNHTTVKNGSIKYGDANCDGTVDLSDAVIIMQSISNPSKFGEKGTDKTHITTQGQINGDVSGNKDGLTNKDALAIQKYMLQLITTLPE